tara:strand:+ start:167 stop:334 length:168 start_codon:yes stop_codon:yes gene_type:complete
MEKFDALAEGSRARPGEPIAKESTTMTLITARKLHFCNRPAGLLPVATGEEKLQE